MTIRQLTSEDVITYKKELILLLRFCYDGNYEIPITDEFCAKKIDGLYRYLEEGRAYLFGAFNEKNELLGFVWGHPCIVLTERRCHNAYGAVMPEARGQGIHGKLMHALEQYAKALGFKYVELAATVENPKVIGHYKKRGYVEERVYLKKEV